MAELEPYADAVLVDYGVSPQAVLDVITGRFTPCGLLPLPDAGRHGYRGAAGGG